MQYQSTCKLWFKKSQCPRATLTGYLRTNALSFHPSSNHISLDSSELHVGFIHHHMALFLLYIPMSFFPGSWITEALTQQPLPHVLHQGGPGKELRDPRYRQGDI